MTESRVRYIVVRHSQPEPGCYYPSDGYAISAFDEQDRAEMFAGNSTTPKDHYEVVPVRAV